MPCCQFHLTWHIKPAAHGRAMLAWACPELAQARTTLAAFHVRCSRQVKDTHRFRVLRSASIEHCYFNAPHQPLSSSSGSAHWMSKPDPSQVLPLKKRSLRKRLLEESSDEELPIIEVFTVETPKPQRVPITESKIRGTAEPRKPRIGSEYQAVLPPLRAPENPLPEQKKPDSPQ